MKEDECDPSLQSCLNQTRRGTTQRRRRNPSIIAVREKQRRKRKLREVERRKRMEEWRASRDPWLLRLT